MIQFGVGNFTLGAVYYVYNYYYGYNCSGDGKYCILSTVLTCIYFSLFLSMYNKKYTGSRGRIAQNTLLFYLKRVFLSFLPFSISLPFSCSLQAILVDKPMELSLAISTRLPKRIIS